MVKLILNKIVVHRELQETKKKDYVITFTESTEKKLNLYILNNGAVKYVNQKLIQLKGQVGKSPLMAKV